MSDVTANILFGGTTAIADDFWEDMKILRGLADRIIEGLPTLTPYDGMNIASAGWTLVTVEPETGYPDFTMPPIPGLFGVPYEDKKGNN
jgi:hypothetical protein